MAVGIAFAKAMGCPVESTRLAFGFKLTKLQGRQLQLPWAQFARDIFPKYSAYQDKVFTFVETLLDTPLSASGNYVNQVARRLFQVFDGFVLDRNVIEDLTQRLIERTR